MLTASACVVVLSIFASLHGIRAFAKEPAQNFPSVAVERGAIFSSSPAITSAGMFYQSMGEDRYILRWLHDGSIRKLYFDGDALLPRAVGPDGPIRFELVSHGKSSIAEFDPQTQKIRLVGNTTGLEDPESVQSPDGKWTAYTLPTEGWNQVWMRGSQRGALMQVTGGNCNSWSPAWELDSSAIIFASDCNRAIGLPSLYRAPIQQIVEHR
jgi:Tol biopolymer transport system component